MTFGEPMEISYSVAGNAQMLQVTSRLRNSHMRQGSQKPQTHKGITSLLPIAASD